MRLAKRLDEVGFSDIVQIRNKVIELRTAGELVHAFHGGEPFFETPEPIKYAMVRALVENKTKYAPSSGIVPLREALVEKLKKRNHLDVTLDDVLITAGGAHALYAAFQAVLDPGDDMLLFSPYWTPIRDMVTGAQARPLLIPHGKRSSQWPYQSPGAVFHGPYQGHLLQHAAESLRRGIFSRRS